MPQPISSIVKPFDEVNNSRKFNQSNLPYTNLVCVKGMYAKRSAIINTNILIIGRGIETNIPCVYDRFLSQRHASLHYDKGFWICTDLGSTNGTIVNGTRCGAQGFLLQPNSIIQCGEQEFRIEYMPNPPKPPHDNDSCWIPKGYTVIVNNYIIPDGMIYVGDFKRSLNSNEVEPALIRPILQVNQKSTSTFAINNDISYTNMNQTQRSAYLWWLSQARNNPNADIFFVSLFFYGLERRVLGNSTISLVELTYIRNEVKRLISIYNLKTKASKFLAIIEGLIYNIEVKSSGHYRNVNTNNPTSLSFNNYLTPNDISNRSISNESVLRWLNKDPDAIIRLSQVNNKKELTRIFGERFTKYYPRGISLITTHEQNKIKYKPQNPSLKNTIELNTYKEVLVPSIDIYKYLMNLLVQCIDDFNKTYIPAQPKTSQRNISETQVNNTKSNNYKIPYNAPPSNPTINVNTNKQETNDFSKLRQWLSFNVFDEPIVISGDVFLKNWTTSYFTIESAAKFAELLQNNGYLIEPDVRFGGEVLSSQSKIVLFYCTNNKNAVAPTKSYLAMLPLLNMAVQVSKADGFVDNAERQVIYEYLDRRLHLSVYERTRLKTHIIWLYEQKEIKTPNKSLFNSLNYNEIKMVARFLCEVAMVDGKISQAELDVIQRFCMLTDLGMDFIHSIVTPLLTETEPNVREEECIETFSDIIIIDDKPSKIEINSTTQDVELSNEIVIEKPDQKSVKIEQISALIKNNNITYKLKDEPKVDITAKQNSNTINIDMDAVMSKIQDTDDVQRMLGEIFTDDDIPAVAYTSENCGNLSAENMLFLKKIKIRSSWTKNEFGSIAKEFNIMPSGIIGIINDISLDKMDEPIFSGEDPIMIDIEVLEALLSDGKNSD